MEKGLNKEYKDWILEEDHPCIMAQTVFSQENVIINEYQNFSSAETNRQLLDDLEAYIEKYDFETNDFQSFIAVFPNDTIASKDEFELILWKQLSDLSKIDKREWDASVSRDPKEDNFSFSLAGSAFYIVGMHPKSSRISRRSPFPTIVFNLHIQFEKLREMGVYQNVRDKIRERDIEVQGSINPMLEDFGKTSEAKQYSGKAADKNWVCPFMGNGTLD